MEPSLKEGDLNILQNHLALRQCVVIFTLLLKWGCKKLPSETYREFIQKKTSLSKYEKNFLSVNQDKLNETCPDKYDVTFLYSLIPIICDGIVPIGTDEHKLRVSDTTSVDYLLKKAKDCRNTLAHEEDKASSLDIFENLKETLVSLIKSAAILYGISKEEEDAAISGLDEEFWSISRKCLSGKWLTDYIIKKLREAKGEMKKSWEENNSHLFLPLSKEKSYQRRKVYSPIKLTSDSNSGGGSRKNIQLDDLLKKRNDAITVVVGNPGSGKTTLLKYTIDRSFDEDLQDVNEFDLVVLIPCRTCFHKDLVHLLKERFPKTLQFLPDEGILDASTQIKINFLIDSYDESNKESKALVNGIIRRSSCYENWSFVVSMRPYALQEFLEELYSSDISSFDVVSIEPITSVRDKENFLRNYWVQDREGSDFSCVIERVSNQVLEMLNSPFLLSMFYALLLSESSEIEKITNEIALFKAIWMEIKKDILNKVIDGTTNVCNPKTVTDKIMVAIEEFSLDLFCRCIYRINQEEYDNFNMRLKELTALDMEFENVLSCVFSRDNDCYQFWHTSFLEYLSARCIQRSLQDIGSSDNDDKQDKNFAPNFARSHPNHCEESPQDKLRVSSRLKRRDSKEIYNVIRNVHGALDKDISHIVKR